MFKGDLMPRHKLAGKCTKCATPLHLQVLLPCQSIFNTSSTFLLQFEWLEASHEVLLYTNWEQKRLVHGIFHTFATNARLAHDVTDTDCWAQKGSTPIHVFPTFKHCFLTNLGPEIKWKIAVSIFCCPIPSKGLWGFFIQGPLEDLLNTFSARFDVNKPLTKDEASFWTDFFSRVFFRRWVPSYWNKFSFLQSYTHISQYAQNTVHPFCCWR